MKRQLQSVPHETDTISLSQLAGERLQNQDIDSLLKRKLGSAVYYIAMSNFYNIDEDNLMASGVTLDTADLGFFAYYAGMKDTQIERRISNKSHLGLVGSIDDCQLACFKPVDMSGSNDRRLRDYDISVGGMLDTVGIDVYEQISIQSVRTLLSQTRSADDIARTQLHLV